MRNHLHHLCAVSIIAITPGIALAQAGGHGQGDIVVTAAPLGQKADETTTPVVTLTGEELIHRRAATLGETLAGQPGINFENFGGGASRPIIRGQSSPRVQVLSDSANVQDASAISPDHNVTGEPLLLRGIEVLRGPATLLYGSGAIGGVVDIHTGRIPHEVPEKLTADFEQRLTDNANQSTTSGRLEAGFGNMPPHWRSIHLARLLRAARPQRELDCAAIDGHHCSHGVPSLHF